MIEIISKKLNLAELPYTLRLYGVTEEMFDELTDEDTRAELIDGVMTVHSPASLRHKIIRTFLGNVMQAYAETRELGLVVGPDAVVHLATGRKFAPDLFFVSQERAPDPTKEKIFTGCPDLVVDILSPHNRYEDLNEKRPAYQDAGAGEIWLIDPDAEEVQIDQRLKKRYRTKTLHKGRIESSVMAGFWLEAEWLWSYPLPKVLPTVRSILEE